MPSLPATAIAITCFCWAAMPIVDAAEIRTWADTTGRFKREAVFDRVDGEAVVLKTADGEELTVPLARLSATDQAYVKKAAAPPPADDPFQPLPGRPQTALNADRKPAIAGDVRTVIAKGVGNTIEDAKKDAYREAVRQVVGAYVEADTLTRNDELIEDKVLALSGALVQKADVISESVTPSAGLIQVRVRAEVRITEVLKTLATLNVTTTAVRTSDLAAQLSTTADQAQTAEALLGDAKTWEAFPASFFRMTATGQPHVKMARGNEASVELSLCITPDSDHYFAFAKRLCAILSKLDGPKGSFTINGTKPACHPDEVQKARDKLAQHVLVSSVNRGNVAAPEIAYAFPEHQRAELQAHFKDMGAELRAKSGCLVYCFDQGNDGNWSLDGCGLKDAATQWHEALGRKHDELLIVCLLTQANESYSRTKWEWFTCDRALFPAGAASPWRRSIECEISVCDSSGREITSEVLPLSQGFAVSRGDWEYRDPIVMLGPLWIEADAEPIERGGYVPQFSFPRVLELTASEASSIAEVKCLVRPRVLPQED